MKKSRTPAREPGGNEIDIVLAAMNADELREVVREMLLELDGRAHGRVVNSLMKERPSERSSKWESETGRWLREVGFESMRKAAERRVEGVTGQKRRRHYGHAANLVAICAAIDPSPTTAQWVTHLRDEHRRYPALRAELDRQVDNEVNYASC